jgi:nicotinamide riboside transporter PnuC
LIDWIAAGFELSGAYLVGHKRRVAFPLFIIGNIFWVWVAVEKELWGLLALMVAFMVVNIRNWIKWGKSEHIASTGTDTKST